MDITVRTRKDVEEGRYPGAIDHARVDAMTDEDIDRQIAENPDAARELGEAFFKRARRMPPLVRRKVPVE